VIGILLAIFVALVGLLGGTVIIVGGTVFIIIGGAVYTIPVVVAVIIVLALLAIALLLLWLLYRWLTKPKVPKPKPPPPECSVRSGPTYSPSGTIPVTKVGAKKTASFTFSASFNTDPAKGKKPACCEIRQFIQWDKTYGTWHGGPPHSGFPSGTPPGTWIEDRDTADKRYGHRSGPHSDPILGCGDEYKTAGVHDQLNGDTYCGRDSPGTTAPAGQWQFQLHVIDTCKGGTKASSSIITINW
jgi:hypothetical protein